MNGLVKRSANLEVYIGFFLLGYQEQIILVVGYYSLALSRPASVFCPVIEMMLDYGTLFCLSISTEFFIADYFVSNHFILLIFNGYKILELHSLHSRNSGLVVKVLDSQNRGPMFKLTRWLQVRHNFSSFRGRSNEYQEFLGTSW